MNTDVSQIIESSGWVWTFVTVYIWGLGMNLTPCVYPMIPITISYFGGTAGAGTTRTQSLARAVLFVLGMATTYSVLGVSAALTGKIFGASMGNPWVIAFVSVVMVLMALSMFGVFQMAAPSSWLTGIQDLRDRLGLLGALFFGLVIGVVMAPCVGPFIVALLAYVGAKGDPLLGFTMFFTLAVGMGTPYLVLGWFTSALASLPRPGMWMVWLEHFFGFVLIGYAFVMWRPFIPSPLVADIALALYTLGASLWLGLSNRSAPAPLGFRRMRTLVAVGGCVVAAWLGGSALRVSTPAPPPQPTASGKPGVPAAMTWVPYSDTALKKALAEGRPIMIDFYATWCAACKELDDKTYTDPRVIEKAQGFVNMKADFTKVADVDSDPTAKRFAIKGLPTVIFFRSDGTEVKDLRQEQFVPADLMLELMARAAAPSR